MKKVIPEAKITICDVCKRTDEGDNKKKYWAHNGGLLVRRDALDYQGCAVASANVNLDLCDSCLDQVTAVINRFAEEKRTHIGNSYAE